MRNVVYRILSEVLLGLCSNRLIQPPRHSLACLFAIAVNGKRRGLSPLAPSWWGFNVAWAEGTNGRLVAGREVIGADYDAVWKGCV